MNKVRYWRDMRSHSQLKLAELAGVSRRTIIYLEEGRSARAATQSALADALNVPLRALFPDLEKERRERARGRRLLNRHRRGVRRNDLRQKSDGEQAT